ncbi:hypothetical protein JCM10212_003625 [Sporobolomyces blumeae]
MARPAPQAFQVGSRWPLWGEDVLLELAFHRRALDEGFVPREWTPPGADPTRTHWYECFWNDSTPSARSCPYLIRVDEKTDGKCKVTTEVETQHTHRLAPLTTTHRLEAERRIQTLESETEKEIFKALTGQRAPSAMQTYARLARQLMSRTTRTALGPSHLAEAVQVSAPSSKPPVRLSADAREPLSFYLAQLDTSGAYDFTCYLDALQEGSITT